MDFLDNLENSLKGLEAQEERDPGTRQRRKDDRARALATGPWAEKLKNSEYTKRLFDEAAVLGRRLRTKIYMSWLEQNLLLEAKGRRLQLRPTPEGIVAVFIEPDGQERTEPLDLSGEPKALLEHWLG